MIAAAEPSHCALYTDCAPSLSIVLLSIPLALFPRDPLLSLIWFAVVILMFYFDLVTPAPHIPQLDPIEVERWVAG